jgi:short subunit dehydrogenase
MSDGALLDLCMAKARNDWDVAGLKCPTGPEVSEITPLPPNGQRVVWDLQNIFRFDDQGSARRGVGSHGLQKLSPSTWNSRKRRHVDTNAWLKNRGTLVSGASRGIGAVVAWLGSRRGRRDHQLSRACRYCRVSLAEMLALGRRAIAVQANVSVAADVRRMVSEVESQLGPVDILVNNAVIALRHKLEDTTDEERDEVMTVNLKSVLLPAQAGDWRRR